MKDVKLGQNIGTVVSDKMIKTAVVEVIRKTAHPLYGKLQKKKKKFMAENTLDAKEGDKVVIVPSRPLSKRKRWKIIKILKDVTT